ncbi:FliH/SctL family protein [Undibacterium sp. TS12]|uniref:FliH/SctL family protein n=1 Tax=Undibacterium sp. TS12 TaxID=2908202 RepID=UPI001F4C8B30|nr:FliH/SctL family protein [Undibacterium sp. TS12]MCH8618702.1 hypothetical protein [Undibacterium sp. TS12]
MASIIRSATLSGHKRTLATRASKVKATANSDMLPAVKVPTPSSEPESPPNASSANNVADLVEQARLSILAQIKDEAEAARELGRQRGMREGHQAGLEAAKAEFVAEFNRIKSITDKLPIAIETGIKGIEDLAVAIAFESICKILGNTVVTLEGVQGLVRQVAQRVSAKEKLIVRLHPSDFKILESGGVFEVSPPNQSMEQVSWKADTDIELGGCIIETPVGDLDARLETQLENLRLTLLSSRR